jgi:hypothetical protein
VLEFTDSKFFESLFKSVINDEDDKDDNGKNNAEKNSRSMYTILSAQSSTTNIY